MAVRIRAGRLRHRVSILTPSTARDADYGEPVASSTGWPVEATVYAAVEPLSGAERFAAQQDVGEVTHRILCRHSTAWTPTSAKRIRLGTRYFDIEAALNMEERGKLWEIMAKEQ
ncbi:MAG: phage head closure protein, partial [Gemmatimonadota bacterium]